MSRSVNQASGQVDAVDERKRGAQKPHLWDIE